VKLSALQVVLIAHLFGTTAASPAGEAVETQLQKCRNTTIFCDEGNGEPGAHPEIASVLGHTPAKMDCDVALGKYSPTLI
jgi:hypothetical protein